MEARSELRAKATAAAHRAASWLGRNWRLLVVAIIAAIGINFAVDESDRQGRLDLSYGYAVRMTCEPDPESHLWSGGCERIEQDLQRTDKPSLLELYQDFITVHHRRIPSDETALRFARQPCEPGFDADAALKGTRYVLEAVRVHFDGVCRADHLEVIKAEIDARDRARMSIEREGLSHAALYAGALANLSEPLVIFAAACLGAALWLL